VVASVYASNPSYEKMISFEKFGWVAAVRLAYESPKRKLVPGALFQAPMAVSSALRVVLSANETFAALKLAELPDQVSRLPKQVS
jgi:hypothetical protein